LSLIPTTPFFSGRNIHRLVLEAFTTKPDNHIVDHIDCDKLWKFGIKRSNKLYKTPRGYLKDAVVYSNKAVSSELKAKRKGKSLYKVICKGEITKEFKSLNKALKYCKSNVDAYFMSGAFYRKYNSSFTPLLEKEDGLWYYYASWKNVSSKTLNNFTNGVIK
jgi:hypothetical protein